MAVKALNKTDCEWWSNKVESAYNSFRGGVKESIIPMEMDIKARDKDYADMAIRAWDERKIVFDGNGDKSIRIYDYGQYLSVRFDIPFSKTNPKFVDAKRDKYMEERCHKIREICEPYAKKRDELLVLIHSRPTTEDLAGIVKWCDEINGLYKESQGCEL